MLLKAAQEMILEVLNYGCGQCDGRQLSISPTCVVSVSLQMLERETFGFSQWWCVGFLLLCFLLLGFCLFFKNQIPSVKDGTTPGKSILKKGALTLRSASTPKVKMVPSVLPSKRGCENKTIGAIKTPHKAAVQSSSSGKRIFLWNITT